MSSLRRVALRCNTFVALVRPPGTAVRQLASSAKNRDPLILTRDKNGVRTLTMNDPAKLNGWTKPMMTALFDAFQSAAADPEVN